ncbi:MAG: YkgJ family cysteine cluster protein [Desulfosudaceae bacterium]
MPYKTVTSADLFQCRMCGDCCHGYGGTYLTESDIERIAAYLSIPPGRFVDQYCTSSGSRLVLAQSENGYCVFWKEKCSIHPVKPRMCKDWPFIEGVLADVANWDIMAAFCPGIQTGFPPDIIRNCVKQEQAKKR